MDSGPSPHPDHIPAPGCLISEDLRGLLQAQKAALEKPHLETSISSVVGIMNFLSMFIVVVVFLVTDHAMLRQHDAQIATNTAVVEAHKKEIVQLESWRDIAPRFTPSDAQLVKAEILREADAHITLAIDKLGTKLDSMERALTALTIASEHQQTLLEAHVSGGK